MLATHSTSQPEATLPVAQRDAGFFCAVTPYYQPIVRTADLSVLAYEALSRGPRDTPLHLARTLFATARTLGEEAALERVCWTAALLNDQAKKAYMSVRIRTPRRTAKATNRAAQAQGPQPIGALSVRASKKLRMTSPVP